MDRTTLVALITAAASLIVAVISLISALISSKNSAKSTRNIETLKHKLDLERKSIEEQNKINNAYLTALSDAIKAIQKVKDAVQGIVKSYKKGRHCEIAIEDINLTSKKLVECYEEQFTSLLVQNNHFEKDLFHMAKGLTIDIQAYIIPALDQKNYASELSVEEKERLSQLRLQLSDIQNQLQSSLYEQLIKRSMVLHP